jgi:hypothetical protein
VLRSFAPNPNRSNRSPAHKPRRSFIGRGPCNLKGVLHDDVPDDESQ